MNSSNKDSDKKAAAQPADAQKKKSLFSFNLGNPLPALGDYSAAKKFTGQIKGD